MQYLWSQPLKKSKSITRDLSIGSIGEQLLIKILTANAMNPVKNVDKAQLKYFDVKADLKGRELLFEVKYDLYSARSGNVAIEFYNPKSCINSGITATKADFWVHTFPGEEIWLAKTSNLIAFCAKAKPVKIITAGGDDNSSMYLYKKDLILSDTFVKIDEANIINVLEELLK